jgi:phytoene dehydrogenase-like protein
MARVVVVGGGFAGTSLAARLAKLRHEVVLLEAGDRLGGRLRGHRAGDGLWQLDLDTFTLPGVLRDLFRKSGRPLDAALTLHTLPGRRHVFADRTVMDLPMGRRSGQVDAFLETFGEDPWSPWLDPMTEPWDLVRRRLLNQVPSADSLDRATRRALHARRPLSREVARTFDDDRVRRMVLDDVVLAGDDPRAVPAATAVRHQVERNFGRWEVEGGMPALADALARRLEERRVDVRLGCSAWGVERDTSGVTGVRTDDGVVPADVVAWCAPTWPDGLPEPALLPRIPAHRALVRLSPDAPTPDLTRDVAVHADPPLHLWEGSPGCWTIAHHKAEDPLVALVRVGIDLRDRVVERHDLAPADLVRLGHWGWQWRGWRTVLQRPGPVLPPGVVMAGAHAHPGPSLEAIGLATEAIAERLGAVPRRPATPA